MRISIELSGRPRKDGREQVLLVLVRRGRARLPLDLAVDPRSWDARKRRVKFGAVHHAAINTALERIIRDAERLSIERPGISPQELRSLLAGPDPTGKTFVELARAYNQREAYRIAAHTVRIRETALRDLERACPGCRALSADVLRTLDRHLVGIVAPNTVRTRMKLLRTMYAGVCAMIGTEPLPVFKGIIRREEDTPARGLTAEEVAKLEAVKLSTYDQQVARDAFLFSMYTGGIRFGDVCRLRPANVVDGALEYRASKSRKPLWVPLIPQALAIIEAYRGEAYLLPILNGRDESERGIDVANAATNRRLKKVAKYAGINPSCSFHYARHSFGHWAVKNKVPVDMLRMIFGHSSLAITQRYLQRIDRDGIREVFGRMGS